MPDSILTISDHDRAAAGMTYVYPVVSRRAGGLSLGINLNPNSACNWRCIYCQVPDLKRGGPPPIDLALLEAELRHMLNRIVHGEFMARQVPEDMRRLNDVALSGNGEPTSAPEFPEVVQIIGRVLADFALVGKILLVLISNGSLAHKTYVREGLGLMAALNGEVWFKLDRATRDGLRLINDTAATPERHYQRLKTVAAICPTWIQTCMFALDGAPPPDREIDAYLALLARAKSESLPLRGVLLYGLARPSQQAQAPRLAPLPRDWMLTMGQRITALGLSVRLTA